MLGAAMSDEATPNKEHAITAEDAVRLKHSLGKSITWGKSDLNALEVERLTKLDKNDYVRIRRDYEEWQPMTQKPYFLLGVLVVCLIGYFLTQYSWVRIIAVVIGITSFPAVSRRAGHSEGYIDGYEAGNEAGIHKILGIKNEEIADMAEMATKMKIDEMVVTRMDERTAKESSDQTKP
jgi:hypothetical protein